MCVYIGNLVNQLIIAVGGVDFISERNFLFFKPLENHVFLPILKYLFKYNVFPDNLHKNIHMLTNSITSPYYQLVVVVV